MILTIAKGYALSAPHLAHSIRYFTPKTASKMAHNNSNYTLQNSP